MQLRNSFTVPAPVDEAWATLLDVQRIAPCMPGASVDSVDGDDVAGRVTVKLGPISVRYQGTITFVEKDERNHRAVLSAAAKDSKGGGTARARIAASLRPQGDQTEVDVVTDLDITGKPAQFGRGVMADVSKRVLDQFATNLAREITSGGLTAGPATAAASSPSPATSATTSAAVSAPPAPAPVEGLDVLSLLKEPAKRAAPPFAAGALIGLLVGWLFGRAGRSGR
jgi:carbon monoxide dehydrogenase subunit G